MIVIKKMRWIVMLLLLLSLPALACSLFGKSDAEATAVPVAEPAEGSAPASEPALEPTLPPLPTEEPAAPAETTGAEPETAPTGETAVSAPPVVLDSALDFTNISESPFDSYRFVMLLDFVGVDANGAEVTQTLNADFAFSKEPPATSMVMRFTGFDTGAGMDEIEMAQIADTTYMVIPEMGCITTGGQDIFQDNPFADMLKPDQFLNNSENAKYEGEETINDIRTLHYSFDKFAMSGSDTDEVDEVDGHLYISKEDGFLVRMVVDATGNMNFLGDGSDQSGNLHVEINLTDVDKPVEIAMPAGCEAGADEAGNDFPMLDDAYEITSFSGVLTYKSDLTADEILAFYDKALTAEGWVKDEAGSFVGEGMARVPYGREGESISLTISPDADRGGNYVVLLNEIGG